MSKIDKAIHDELKDCKKWYGNFLKREIDKNIRTLSDVENAMQAIEPDGDYENCIFSAGYLLGLRSAKRIYENKT